MSSIRKLRCLTHCILMNSSTVKCWMHPFVILGVLSSQLFYFCFKILLANTVDPDQMPHYVASDLGLHCLNLTLYEFPGKNGLIFAFYRVSKTVYMVYFPVHVRHLVGTLPVYR